MVVAADVRGDQLTDVFTSRGSASSTTDPIREANDDINEFFGTSNPESAAASQELPGNYSNPPGDSSAPTQVTCTIARSPQGSPQYLRCVFNDRLSSFPGDAIGPVMYDAWDPWNAFLSCKYMT
jgi:hypothetical protein